uniref:Uncharacterized protein n=1 Tax=Mycena chlorophos TaxID=658473 RepID=A0ABQ0LHL6_MYCCL|nr:predicted protein [Mycena chlorophos]
MDWQITNPDAWKGPKPENYDERGESVQRKRLEGAVCLRQLVRCRILSCFRVLKVLPVRAPPSPLPMELEQPQMSSQQSPGSPNRRGRLYIEIEHHPHSGLPNDIIPLDSESSPESLTAHPARPTRSIVPRTRPPWAPFPTRSDFEWAETMYLQPKTAIKAQLDGLHGSWNPNGTAITIKTTRELDEILSRCRKYVVEFQSYELEEDIDGERRTFTIRFRDPWQWILELVTDPSLANDIVWYPHRKYLVIDGFRKRLRDEFYTADHWWEMQVHFIRASRVARLTFTQDRLPHRPGVPHCIFPLLLWLDEGRVTSHTNMYPMLLRSLSLPSAIRNGSGNGGSFLAGFMAQIKDHRDPKSRTHAEKVDFSFRKRRVYHRVHRRVFVDSLGKRSKDGEAVICGDETTRVLYPAIPVSSIDGKEADAITGTRAALSLVPCARCLAGTDELRDICRCLDGPRFEPRTTELMRRVYLDALAMQRKGEREAYLQSYGLHAVENAFWEIENSDPYAAASYDLLHSDDLGKFGKRLWPAIHKEMETLKTSGLFTRNMGNVPRWPGLKHFENVSTKEMYNGQQYFDIEKCLLPCAVQLLPRNSAWIHLARAHLCYRMVLGLHCISDDQITRKEKYQREYEKWSKAIARNYPQYQFNFPKQHDPYHSSDDVRRKGAPTIYCTRVNEGSHQENRDSATHINHRDNDKQVSEIDALKEAMARIRMTVNMADKEASAELDESAERAGVTAADVRAAITDLSCSDNHWRYGAAVAGKLEDSRSAFSTVRRYNCIYIHYTSEEDYTDKYDLLRCNARFQSRGEERLDCVNVNLSPDKLEFARLLGLFRCRFPSSREEDVALVRVFKTSKWKPFTMWDNCRVLEDGKTMFILPKYFIRGAHLINAFGSKAPERTFYLNDVVDSDWFIRAGN